MLEGKTAGADVCTGVEAEVELPDTGGSDSLEANTSSKIIAPAMSHGLKLDRCFFSS